MDQYIDRHRSNVVVDLFLDIRARNRQADVKLGPRIVPRVPSLPFHTRYTARARKKKKKCATDVKPGSSVSVRELINSPLDRGRNGFENRNAPNYTRK